jgi:protein-L-isoaspartate O-methyltransferase
MKPALLLAMMMLAGCEVVPGAERLRADTDVKGSEFPAADRPVSPIVSSRWSTEEARDKVNEADRVMDIAGITPGMTVADIGAGEGYYTIRLAERVGPNGRVLAQDIVPAVRDKLAERVNRENLKTVSVKLGKPADPSLPGNSFDRVFLVHMYHEIRDPYEFLWRLRPSLRIGGRVIIVEAERATGVHGTPAKLLECELRATGYRRVDYQPLTEVKGYVAAFEASGNRPEPAKIRVCSGS